MSSSNPESVFDLAARAALAREPAALASVEADVMALFARGEPSLCRYVVSCGLAADQAEDVVQDVFLALFRHLCVGRPRTNLRVFNALLERDRDCLFLRAESLRYREI